MKRIKITAGLGILAVVALAGCAEPKIPVGLGNEGTTVLQMLKVYAQLTGKTVLVSSEVRQDDKYIQLRQTQPMTRAEAGKLIEQDLREQAGIVVLHRDRKHVEFGFEADEKIEP